MRTCERVCERVTPIIAQSAANALKPSDKPGEHNRIKEHLVTTTTEEVLRSASQKIKYLTVMW